MLSGVLLIQLNLRCPICAACRWYYSRGKGLGILGMIKKIGFAHNLMITLEGNEKQKQLPKSRWVIQQWTITQLPPTIHIIKCSATWGRNKQLISAVRATILVSLLGWQVRAWAWALQDADTATLPGALFPQGPQMASLQEWWLERGKNKCHAVSPASPASIIQATWSCHSLSPSTLRLTFVFLAFV